MLTRTYTAKAELLLRIKSHTLGDHSTDRTIHAQMKPEGNTLHNKGLAENTKPIFGPMTPS